MDKFNLFTGIFLYIAGFSIIILVAYFGYFKDWFTGTSGTILAMLFIFGVGVPIILAGAILTETEPSFSKRR